MPDHTSGRKIVNIDARKQYARQIRAALEEPTADYDRLAAGLTT